MKALVQPTNNNANESAEIVRNIASFLSLSEMASIVVSATSNTSFQPRCSNQNERQKDEQNHKQNQQHHDQRDLQDNKVKTSHAKLPPLHSSPSASTRKVRKDKTISPLKIGYDGSFSLGSGPDEGAGLGISKPQQQAIDRKRKGVYKSMGEIDSICCNSSQTETPGLVALSPILSEGESEQSIRKFSDSFSTHGVSYVKDTSDSYLSYGRSYDDASESSLLSYDVSYDHRHQAKEDHIIKRKELHAIEEEEIIQSKLQKIVFLQPQPLRSYCQSSHRAASKMKMKVRGQQQEIQNEAQDKACDKSNPMLYHSSLSSSPSICPVCHLFLNIKNKNDIVDQSSSPPILAVTDSHDERNDFFNSIFTYCTCPKSKIRQQHYSTSPLPLPVHFHILNLVTDPIYNNTPLSILFDAASATLNTLFQTFEATCCLQKKSIQWLIKMLVYAIHSVCSTFSGAGPKKVLDFVMWLHRYTFSTSASFNFNSRNGEVGNIFEGGFEEDSDGSVSTLGNLSIAAHGHDSGVVHRVISEKMFRKINKIDSFAAKVITYIERRDDFLTLDAKKRVQRMMYHPVPLRPFIATVKVSAPSKPETKQIDFTSTKSYSFLRRMSSHCMGYYRGRANKYFSEDNYSTFESKEEQSIGAEDDDENSTSPFMCTPKSFPATPSSRAHVLARGTRFAEDIVFLARDQLRVEEGLGSKNDNTRAMSKAMLNSKRLPIFNAVDISHGITLTSGQHCVSKVGNELYCSGRGMVPVLRNCFVYFEMSVATPPLLSMVLHHASLAIGLSTLEIPLNMLVGTCNGSVGLCSTGQVLVGNQCLSPLEPRTYGSGSVVGCLVYLDDGSNFDICDGAMATASIVFNVNGQIITPMMAGESDVSCKKVEKMTTEGSQYHEDVFDDRLSCVLPLCVPKGVELYPTVTLHSRQTEVMCCFSSDDIVAKCREEIGAPSGVAVYAVDGSVLFEEEDAEDDKHFLRDLSNYSTLDSNFLVRSQ